MINYLAILVSAILAFAVGALWYGPLFGKQWRQLMGVPEGSMGVPGTTFVKSMSGGFIATLVLTFVLANIFQMMGVTTVSLALTIAFWIWLGFIATVMLNSVWYEGRSLQLYLINVSHYLIAILLAALVLAWWPW
jgi:hypothetical protein